MKYHLLPYLIGCYSLFGVLHGQTTPDPYPDCTTSSFRLSELFMDAYGNGDLDEARAVVDLWTGVCGLQEVVNRALLLLKLRSNEVMEADYLGFQYPMLKEYFYRRQLWESGDGYAYEYDRPYFGFIPIGRRYDIFTVAAFRELYQLGDPELRFLRDVYASNPTVDLTDLAGSEYEGTVLRKRYDEEREAVESLTENHYSLFAGAWIPFNEDNFVGSHPEIGFSLGIKRLRWNCDFLLGFRFLKSANTYLASRERNGPLEETDKFFGGFLGLSGGYDLLQTDKSEVQFSLQLAADGWDMLEETATEEASSLIRFVVSPGLQYRYLLKERTYLGLYVRYHHTDYRNSERIGFEVNPLSIGVVYGFSSPMLFAR